MDKLSHLDEHGAARMVDVSAKAPTARRATAEAYLLLPPNVVAALAEGRAPKGNVFETARIAGIMAAKRTADLVPLCHPLPLDHVRVDFAQEDDRLRIVAEAVTRAVTGVEMEALTAATVAGLTLYDMLKALSHEMCLTGVRLLHKEGGKSGPLAPPEASST